jgi:hypothetical protein
MKPQINKIIRQINYTKLCKEIGMPPYEKATEVLDDTEENEKTW